MNIFCLLTLLLLPQAHAFSTKEDDEIEKSLLACAGSPDVVCFANIVVRVDRILNAEWRDILRRLGRDAMSDEAEGNNPRVKQLRTAQRAWLVVRAEQCYLESLDVPAEAARLAKDGCEVRFARFRARELHAFAKPNENNVPALTLKGKGVEIRERHTACDKRGSTIYDSIACNESAFLDADKLLNDLYQDRIRTIQAGRYEALQVDPEGDVKRLRQGQRAWITFRDQECLFESTEVSQDSEAEIFERSTACRLRQTHKRIVDLRLIIKAIPAKK